MTMNIFGKKSFPKSVDYKSRLEYKLYLARESPEPVFDLSECNLRSVPAGIYSLCRVFRKERLLLQVNQLTSLSGGGQWSDLCLLTVLDLHRNHLASLPEDIGHLTNLQELNISHNELKKLPEALGRLNCLRVLDGSHNKLRCLPASLGQLSCLTSLDLRGNPSLLTLPPSLSETPLQQLLVDEHSLPADITVRSTVAILEYLSQCNGTKYIPDDIRRQTRCELVEEGSQPPDSFTLLEKKKEEKMRELLEVEKYLQDQKNKEYEMHENKKMDKDKLLMCLKEHQRKVEEDVSRFQALREQERVKLLNHLLQVEKQAEGTIEDLLALNQALLQSSQWQEQDRKEQQLLNDYKSRDEKLRRKEVLDAMESLLVEEFSRKEQFFAYEKNRAELIQDSLSKEVEWNQQISSLICARDARQTALLSAVEADMSIQKALVATLLEQSDLHSQTLVVQVTMVEQQLAVLTAVELQRRNIDSHQHLSDLSEKRKALSDLLVELLREQSERRRHLVHQLDMDTQVYENTPDYWLRQYQRLLDTRPPQLRTALDPLLVHELVAAGVAHCLPFLTCCHIASVTPAQLSEIGVTNESDRVAVMAAVNAYLTHTQAELMPSAPPEEEASAPPLPSPSEDTTPECVVCMEAKCAIVFVPCGHLCTCAGCATQLFLCPLCRASLERKIHIILP